MTPHLPDDLITVREAARLLRGRSLSAVYRWIRQGRLRAWSVGGRVMVSCADVLGMIHPLVPAAPAPAPRTAGQEHAGAERALAALRGRNWRV